jgi:ATP:corrinoid adenosyltransferase
MSNNKKIKDIKLRIDTIAQTNLLMSHQITALQYSSKTVAEKPIHVKEPSSFQVQRKNMTNKIVQYIPRGNIIWASTGAGKTTISAGIALQYIASGRQVFIVSTVQNIRSNNIEKYTTEMYTRFRPWVEALYGPVGMAELRQKISKVVNFFSYRQFQNCFTPNGTVKCTQIRDAWNEGKQKIAVIIDESHDLANVPRSWHIPQREGAEFLHEWLMNGQNRRKIVVERVNKNNSGKKSLALHVTCMTATPGDSISEWIRTLQYVDPLHIDTRDGFKRWPFVNSATQRDIYVEQTRKFLHTYGNAIKSRILVGVELRDQKFGNTRILARQMTQRNPLSLSPIHFIICMAVLGRVTEELGGPSKSGYVQFRQQMEESHDQFLLKLRVMQNYLTQADIKKAFDGMMQSPADKIRSLLLKQGNFEELAVRQTRGGKRNMVFASSKLKAIATYIGTGVHPGQTKVSNASVGPLKGRQLVYTADTKFTANILSHYLQQLPKRACFRNVSKIIFQGRDLRTPLVRLYDARGTHKCQHNLVVAKGTSDVATAVKIMNAEKRETLVRLHNIDISIKKAKQNRNQYLASGEYGMLNNNENRRLRALRNMYQRHLDALKEVKHNLHGEILKMVILQGGDSFQGLDIQALRHVHMIDHMATHKRHKQLLGRGARGFGHALLNNKNQDVKLVQYHMQAPVEFDNFASIETWVDTNLRGMFKGKNETEQIINQKKFLSRVEGGLQFLQKYKLKLFNKSATSLPPAIMTLNDIMPNHRNQKQSVRNLKEFEKFMRS